MQIKDTDIYKTKLFYIQQGIYRKLRKYALSSCAKKKDGDEEAVLSAAVYPQPYCWEETEDEKKQIRDFPFTEEGRSEMIEWLNRKLSEF